MSTMKTRSYLNPSNRCCSVPQCKYWRGVSLHHFPVNMKMRKKWINVLRIGKPITSHMFVCASHFVKEDFIPSFKPIRKRLKKIAIPSLHLPRRPLDKILTAVQIDSQLKRASRVERRQILRNSISRSTAKVKKQSVQDIQIEDKSMQEIEIQDKGVDNRNMIISSESVQVDHKACERKLMEEDDLGFAMTTFMCSECKQPFANIRLFDLHISGFHSDNVESMFFPNYDDYIIWKHHMEEQTRVKYAILNKYTIKKIFHCTFLPSIDGIKEDTLISYLCPSSIIVQEFCKGIQVHYYKQHFGHPHDKYALDEEYKKYTFTTIAKPVYGDITDMKSDKTDLYVQFKTLMECIVLDAAEINVDILGALIGKALDMTSVFNNYIEEDFDINGKAIESALISVKREKRDGQISNTLEVLNSQMVQVKQKLDVEVLEKKRTRKRALSVQNGRDLKSQIENQSPKIINTFSLAENPDLSKMFKEIESIEAGNTKNSNSDTNIKKYIPFIKSLSFNDTYKNFVNKNFKTTLQQGKEKCESNDKNSIENNNKNSLRKKAVVKTKMQQIKQNLYHDNTPKVDSNPKVVSSKTVDSNTITVSKEKKAAVKTKMQQIKQSERHDNTPKVNSNPKVVSSKTVDTNVMTAGKERKAIVKTKTQQMKQSVYHDNTPKLDSNPEVVSSKTVDTNVVTVGKERKAVKTKTTPKVASTPKVVSPKTVDTNIKTVDKESRTSFSNVKVLEYEVKEQENDCNILILKI